MSSQRDKYGSSRFIRRNPEDADIMGEIMEINEEYLEIDENIDTFYDPNKNMLYLGDGERVIGLRKRNSAGEEVIFSKDVAPVSQYEEILREEGFPAVVAYAEADDFAGYDPKNGFYKSPEEQRPEATIENRSNVGDQSVSRVLGE